MAAFQAALDAGFDGIETDIRLDADGTPILFHDRVHAGRPVASLTRAALSSAVGYPVPTLAEALNAFPTTFWNLELKSTAAVEPTIGALRARAGASTLLLSSFIHPALATLSEALALDGALLIAHRPLTPPVSRPRGRVNGIVWYCGTTDPEIIAQSHAAGWKNLIYGFASRAEQAAWEAENITALITDFAKSPER